MELFTLIGDSDENFYQLGLRDRQTAKEVHNDVRLMLKSPWRPLNKIIEELIPSQQIEQNIRPSDSLLQIKEKLDVNKFSFFKTH